MSEPADSLIPTLATVLLAAVIALSSNNAGLATDTCAAQANCEPTNGGRWYCRIDRANHRKCERDTAVWLEAALLPEPGERPGLFSWISSLAAGLRRPTFTEARPEGKTIDSPLTPTTATAYLTINDSSPKERRIEGLHSGQVRGPELRRKPMLRRIVERPDHQTTPQIDQGAKDTLFQEFLRWREQQPPMR